MSTAQKSCEFSYVFLSADNGTKILPDFRKISTVVDPLKVFDFVRRTFDFVLYLQNINQIMRIKLS